MTQFRALLGYLTALLLAGASLAIAIVSILWLLQAGGEDIITDSFPLASFAFGVFLWLKAKSVFLHARSLRGAFSLPKGSSNSHVIA